jgi:hypothetical protein
MKLLSPLPLPYVQVLSSLPCSQTQSLCSFLNLYLYRKKQQLFP